MENLNKILFTYENYLLSWEPEVGAVDVYDYSDPATPTRIPPNKVPEQIKETFKFFISSVMHTRGWSIDLKGIHDNREHYEKGLKLAAKFAMEQEKSNFRKMETVQKEMENEGFPSIISGNGGYVS